MRLRHRRPTVASVTHTHHEDAPLADLLDLDGEVLRDYWADAVLAVRHATEGSAPARVVDLGAGTGVGTLELARRFGAAEVIAVDTSAEMLERVTRKALEAGLAERVHAVQADLDEGWPAVGTIDVTWASLSMHHFADPDRVLRDVFTATRAGGVVAVAEFEDRLRFLPDDLGFGRPGLELRCFDALDADAHHSLPNLGAHWAPRLAAAGFADVTEREFAIVVDSPLPSRATQYAHRWLGRMRHGLADRLDPDDLATMDELLGDGPRSLHRRDDLRIHGSRLLTLARRP
jgi:SAM-dependent methyltransferase